MKSAEEKIGSGFQECVRDACDAQKYCGLTGHALVPAQEKRILDTQRGRPAERLGPRKQPKALNESTRHSESKTAHTVNDTTRASTA